MMENKVYLIGSAPVPVTTDLLGWVFLSEFEIPFRFTKKIPELAISFRQNLESESIGNLMYGPEP